MNCNTYEINEMIDLLEDFFTDNRVNGHIIVGGMIGSFVFKYAIDAALINHSFSKVLVVEGCQDYIGISKNKIPNFVYYGDLFIDTLHDPLAPYNPFKPTILNPKPNHVTELNTPFINNFEVIILNDAHLIPTRYINSIKNNFIGKLCIVVDPFDVGGEKYSMNPTVVDSLNKLSPMVAMSRKVYGVGTRAIDISVRGIVKESKINKRSIGKIDNKQYISNDEDLINTIRQRQILSPFRKNQRLLVTSNIINSSFDDNKRRNVLTKNSMCVVSSSNPQPLMKLRIYNSETIFSGDVSYAEDAMSENSIIVQPANILSVNESVHHRYNHAVLVETDNNLTQSQIYSILKNCNNLTVTHIS